MVVDSIPRSLPLCPFGLIQKDQKIKTQKSFPPQGRTPARFCVGHRAGHNKAFANPSVFTFCCGFGF